MSDEDPMAFLNQKRAEMQAMAQMAEVASIQAQLAADVKTRMDKIDAIMNAPLEPREDAEVDYWKKKIASLSDSTLEKKYSGERSSKGSPNKKSSISKTPYYESDKKSPIKSSGYGTMPDSMKQSVRIRRFLKWF